MSKEDLDQTLIPKDDEEQWRKVLHGEMVSAEDNNTQLDAAAIRSYLIARDEAQAVTSVAEIDDLNTLSEEEARVVYHRASEEIRLRGKSTWVEAVKKYGAVFVIGGLTASVLFLLLNKDSGPLTAPQQAVDESLNYADYQVIDLKELPGLVPNMLLIAGGSFTAGCSNGWDDAAGGCRTTEFPAHSVDIKTFELAQHEVTVGQFAHFVEQTQYLTDAEKEGKGCVHQDMAIEGHPWVMNTEFHWRNPGYEQDDHFPATCISWNDTQSYLKWLSDETKTTYRLPTEAEWEYAARGGKATAYSWGSVASNDQANYKGVGGQDQWAFAAPVGSFPANPFSVQDMSGNVWEWVQDCWHKTYHNAPSDGSAWESNCSGNNTRVRRGGGWDAGAAGIRSAIRSSGGVFDRSNLYGFRVAREWQKQK